MSSTVVFLIVIVGLIAAAAVFSLATARRRDQQRALGDAEPAAPEAAGVAATPGTSLARAGDAAPAGTGRELERAVALERQTRSGLPDPSAPPPPPALPPDEETLG